VTFEAFHFNVTLFHFHLLDSHVTYQRTTRTLSRFHTSYFIPLPPYSYQSQHQLDNGYTEGLAQNPLATRASHKPDEAELLAQPISLHNIPGISHRTARFLSLEMRNDLPEYQNLLREWLNTNCRLRRG